MSEYGEPQSRNEAILQNMLGEDNELLPPQSRIEVLLQLLLEELKNIEPGGAAIDDTVTALDKVWSSSKVDSAKADKENAEFSGNFNVGNSASLTGTKNISLGENSNNGFNQNVLIGDGLKAISNNRCVIIGKYNEIPSSQPEARCFLLGTGIQDNMRFNAIEIYDRMYYSAIRINSHRVSFEGGNGLSPGETGLVTFGSNMRIRINKAPTENTSPVRKQELDTKQDRITLSNQLTLSVNGWDANTKQQTVAIDLDTAKRNVIDITIGENKTWNTFGVYPISITETGITFEADTIPDTALTFKVCSMSVN